MVPQVSTIAVDKNNSEEVITIEDSDEDDEGNDDIITVDDSEESEDSESPVDVSQYIVSLEPKQYDFQRDSTGKFICPEISCSYKINHRPRMTRHYRKHSGEKPFQCKLCGEKFTQKSNCIRHIRGHVDPCRFKCPRCEAKYTENRSLKKHIMRQHYVDV